MKQLASAVVPLVILVACGSPSAPPIGGDDGRPAPGGTVVIGLLSDIQSWNPYLVEDLDSEQVLSLIYPSLAVEQPDYRLHPPSFEPALARSWSWSDDHRVLTLELDPTARWSDGVPISSADVVFTWQVQTSDEVGWLYGDSKSTIERVEPVDEDTVRVVFTHEHPYQMMELNDGLIIPAHVWGNIPFADWSATDWRSQVVAGGPFTLDRHVPQQEISLVRNPGYATPDRPYLDRVVFRIVPSEQSLVTQLLAGDIDFLQSIPPSEFNRFRRRDGIDLVIYDGRSYSHVCWNTTRPALADRRVRQALTTAIDRQTLIDVVYAGFGRIAVGPVLSTFWAFDDRLAPLPFDPAAAQALLAEAGWRDSDNDGMADRDGAALSVELLAPAENETRQDLAILIQEDLRRVGVAAELRIVEWGTMVSAMQSGEFDGLINQWQEPTRIDLDGIWHSAGPGDPTFNFGRYSNPEVDHLLSAVADVADFHAREPLYDRIQELIVADQPYTFLVETVRITAHSSRIHGADINAATPYFNIGDWFVRTEADR
ncbi:MAG: ABC transporter substrate-binding protein [Holophagae bacterium]|jgi:peptide/nickel transport system substrate-binding protein